MQYLMMSHLSRLAIADFLAGLEVGITRAVGASQRLRLQVERIDEYMATQRQQDIALSSVGQGAYVSGNLEDSIPSAAARFQQSQHNSLSQIPLTEAYGLVGSANNMSGIDGSGDQFQVLLPPELLDNWPWPLDITQGFRAI
jgi:hypothetical protein